MFFKGFIAKVKRAFYPFSQFSILSFSRRVGKVSFFFELFKALCKNTFSMYVYILMILSKILFTLHAI